MLIPTFVVREMSEAIGFYTRILDFRVAMQMPDEAPFYAILSRGADELHLSLPSGRVPPGHGCAIVVCDEPSEKLFAPLSA